MTKIVLASGSPRRQELLKRIGITDFEIRVPKVEESYQDTWTPHEIVASISRQKSLATPSSADEIVISADTMVFLNNEKLGKPKDENDALRMLKELQDNHHIVCTGVTLRQGEKVLTKVEETTVFFRALSDEELRSYIRSGEPMDKAGAYGVQGQGSLLVKRIEGDFFNVMGLPIVLLSEMLKEFGVSIL